MEEQRSGDGDAEIDSKFYHDKFLVAWSEGIRYKLPLVSTKRHNASSKLSVWNKVSGPVDLDARRGLAVLVLWLASPYIILWDYMKGRILQRHRFSSPRKNKQ